MFGVICLFGGVSSLMVVSETGTPSWFYHETFLPRQPLTKFEGVPRNEGRYDFLGSLA